MASDLGRRVAGAGLVALLLIGAVVVSEVVLPKRKRAQLDARTLLLAPGERPASWTIERGGRMLELRPRPDGAWDVVADGRTSTADVRAVNDLERALSGTRLTGDVGAAADLKLEDFGLRPPRAVLSWTRPNGRAWTLALGSPTIGGQAHALADGRVALVPAPVLEAADRDAGRFRQRRLLNAQDVDVEAIEIERHPETLAPGAAPRIALRRAELAGAMDDEVGHEWILDVPHGVPAQPVLVASLLSRLASLEAKSFGADEPSPEDLARAGLAPPAAVMTLRLAGGRTAVVEIGSPSPPDHAWARVDGGPIVEIRQDIGRDALLPDDFWRDNRIVRVPRWRLINLQVRKSAAIDLEMAREPGGAWRLVRPSDAALEPELAERVLAALDDVLCGRFEDELAADPAALARRFDFLAPGSLEVRALALLPDGSPRRADVELTLFLNERTPYFAARMVDEMGRVHACVTLVRAVDAFVAVAREANAVGEAARAPEAGTAPP